MHKPYNHFVNKMDRDSKNLLICIRAQQSLKIKVRPLTWPIGMGDFSKGFIFTTKFNLFSKQNQD